MTAASPISTPAADANANADADATSAPEEVSVADIVIIDWNDLQPSAATATATDAASDNVLESALLALKLERAFSAPSSTGIVAIRNVPGFVAAKQACLPLAHTLAHLPADYLEGELTDPDSLFNSGWSHGKEKLGDEPDTAKGSFYYNPVTDLPGTPEDRATYPLSYPANKWPAEERIPNFKTAAKELGCILRDTTALLSRHIDALAKSKVPSYENDLLYKAMKDTDKVKCRLLYYFPLEQDEPAAAEPATGTGISSASEATSTATPNSDKPRQDSWIGWHNDSGFLTALAGDFYLDDRTGTIIDCPDDAAGLYVMNRMNQVQRVVIPPDCMAVQMGECTQIVTGGAVAATPHCVRGVGPAANANTSTRTGRISLPCFIDTPPAFLLTMPSGCTREQVLDAAVVNDKVPPLSKRWIDGMPFGIFLRDTFSMYYDWNKE
jgi:isopenicillin N synthase-like dioxygenase